MLSVNVYRVERQTKTIYQLIARTRRQLKLLIENDENFAQRLLRGVNSELRKIAKEGFITIN